MVKFSTSLPVRNTYKVNKLNPFTTSDLEGIIIIIIIIWVHLLLEE